MKQLVDSVVQTSSYTF